MATTTTQININRELRKDQWKEMALQQQSHIGLLMKRLEMEKDMYSKMYTEKLEVEEELQEFKNYYDSMLADILRLKSELAQVKEERDKALAEVLTDGALERLQDEAFKAGRAKGYEDAEAEFRPYEKQRELDAIRDELAEIKENMFPCDVYWSANNGDITLHKIPHEIACLNTLSGDNAILEAFQNGFFGEEWGSYSSLSVVEMTREELADLGGLVEREDALWTEPHEEANANCSVCGADGTWLKTAIAKNEQLCSPCADAEDAAEEPTPKSMKDLAIDELNEFLETTSTTLRMTYDEQLVRTEEQPAPAFEPLHEDATHQVVRGHFNVEFIWKVPAGINLRDTETYEFGDKWGVLYIENMKTGEKWDIEEKDEEDDFKRAYDLEVEDRDDDENTC